MATRIVTDPKVLSGKPAVAGTRIPVSLILNLLAHGYTVERVVEAYPTLTAEDVKAALLYAAEHLPRTVREPVPEPV